MTLKERKKIEQELLFHSYVYSNVVDVFKKKNWLNIRDFIEIVRVSMLEAKKLK